MKKNIWLLFTILCFGVLSILQGCAKSRNDNAVLARIDNTETITVGEFTERIARLPERYQEIINKNKKEFLDEVIIDRLLYKDAVKRKLDKDKEVQQVFEEAKRKILIARLLKDQVDGKVQVAEEDVDIYYDENKDKFTMPEVLRASHILVKTKEDAQDILVELSNGRNFEDLARARSVDPTAKNGGDLGHFTKNQMVPEIDEVCLKLQVGEISDVVKTNFGYHIVKLTERREPRVKSMDEVHDNIEQALMRQKKALLFNEYVEKLKEQSQITIDNKILETISLETQSKES
ncbi:MAG: peptidylprolyl isomerase [Candidatus Omnitrophota bacterium]